MNGFHIKSCTEGDYEPVLELLKQLWPDSELNYETLKAVYIKALNSDTQKYIVGLVDDKIIGFCSLTIKNNLWQAGNLGHIDELIVDKNFRERGYGKKLMDEITHIAKQNGCKRIELDSAFHREEAHRFYENQGYYNRAYLFSKEICTNMNTESKEYNSLKETEYIMSSPEMLSRIKEAQQEIEESKGIVIDIDDLWE
jgi:Acetyltransferases